MHQPSHFFTSSQKWRIQSFLFFYRKKNIIFCIKKNLFNFLWGIAADTSLDGSIYCVLFAWLPCLPPFARDCFVRDFFLTPTDFSMVSWIFTKKSFRFFVFQQSWYFYCTIELLFCFYGQNKTIFCIFQTYKNYFSCFFIVARDGTIFENYIQVG